MKKIAAVFLILFILTGCMKDGGPYENSVTVGQTQVGTDTSGLSNEKTGWGYRRLEGQRPEFTRGQIATMEKFDCIYMGNAEEKTLYLTFDEGYENGYTEQILDTLKKQNVPAAFFVTGQYLKENGKIIDRMVNEGHIVGNHTLNHPSLPDKTDEEIEKDVSELNEIFEKKYGFSMKYIRPPMGEYSERTLAVTNNMGYKSVFWSFAYKDWERDKNKGADYAYQTVTKGMHNGIVILLHAVSGDNAAALDSIITYAKNMGYQFKSLDEYK